MTYKHKVKKVYMDHVRSLAGGVKLLALDVDGVMTDGRLVFDEKGNECKTFHARDGFGIRQCIKAGIEVAMISGRKSVPVEKRAAELGIAHVYLGVGDKLSILEDLCSKINISIENVCYLGDDVPDIECMSAAGIAIAVADAHPDLDAVADWHTLKGGGHGAVREACDLLLEARH